MQTCIPKLILFLFVMTISIPPMNIFAAENETGQTFHQISGTHLSQRFKSQSSASPLVLKAKDNTTPSKQTSRPKIKEKQAIPAQPGSLTQSLKSKEPDLPIYNAESGHHQNFEAVIPEEYANVHHQKGSPMGHPANTLINSHVTLVYTPLKNNTGQSADYDKVNAVLDVDGIPNVGMNGIHTFFGHYYGAGSGAFSPLVQSDLLSLNNEFIVTDANGLSKGYRITQVIPVQMNDQYNFFYNEDSVPYLAYHGNGDDMIAMLTCRWDKAIGQMDFSIGYRIW